MTAIATRTRERLLDVARQLFASNGVERTTMNDIATASDKGRRTIYTYFKNKKDIYNAVIEREADSIVRRFAEIVESDMPPLEMLQAYLRARFDIVDETIKSSTTSQIISYITLDYKKLERIRRVAVEKELDLFKRMIDRGVSLGVFDPEQGALVPAMYQIMFQGVDYCHLCGNYSSIGVDRSTIREDMVRFLTNTLVARGKPTDNNITVN